MIFQITPTSGRMVVETPSGCRDCWCWGFLPLPATIFDGNRWGHAQGLDGRFAGRSHIFSRILGPLQSEQRALQAYSGIHIGIDHLDVLRGVAKLIDQGITGTPLLLVKGGDLLGAIHSMLCLRGIDTVKVSKVKGHATQAMVDNGDVRLEDLIGNDGADTATDLGSVRQQDYVITARRALLRAWRHWHPIMLELQRFMVAISRIEVNHDGYGGTAPGAIVWDKGGLMKPLSQGYHGLLITSWSPWIFG